MIPWLLSTEIGASHAFKLVNAIWFVTPLEKVSKNFLRPQSHLKISLICILPG